MRGSSFSTVPRTVFVIHSASGVTAMSDTSADRLGRGAGRVLLVVAGAREHDARGREHRDRRADRAPPSRRGRAAGSTPLERERRGQVEDPREIAGEQQDQRQ